MCNPLWDNVFLPNVLVVEIENNCGARVKVDGKVVTQARLEFQLAPGSEIRVRVEVESTGADCTVFVTARLDGADQRSDVCSLRVTQDDPFAFETITVATR